MAGSHLADYLLSQGEYEIFGTMRWRSRMDNLAQVAAAGRLNTLEGLNLQNGASLDRHVKPGWVNVVECDVCDPTSTSQMIASIRPDRIFHLAAQSFVPTSWHAPSHTIQTNVIGQLNLLEAVRQAGIEPRVHIAGSSEQYGLVREDEVPIRESNPFRPLSPYAVSKIAQEMMAYQYHKSYGLFAVVTRGFNHTGPRRGQVLVTSSFAKQIAEIEADLRPPVMDVGDLSSRRDWSDVRDMVKAYWLALERCEPGIQTVLERARGLRVEPQLGRARLAPEVNLLVAPLELAGSGGRRGCRAGLRERRPREVAGLQERDLREGRNLGRRAPQHDQPREEQRVKQRARRQAPARLCADPGDREVEQRRFSEPRPVVAPHEAADGGVHGCTFIFWTVAIASRLAPAARASVSSSRTAA